MKTQVKETVTINEDQGLFVIPCGGSVTGTPFKSVRVIRGK